MDINMPIMNGLEATKILKQEMSDEKVEKIYIFACSAYDDMKTKHSAFEAGVDHYFSKPVKMKELVEILGRFNILRK
jgi:CheY-like chemotaxis protein